MRLTRRPSWVGMNAAAGVVLALMAAGAAGCDKLPGMGPKGAGAGAGAGGAMPAPAAPVATAGEASHAQPTIPGRPAIEPLEILANVNGVAVSRADIELRLQELKALVDNVGQEWTTLSTEQLQVVLEELINNELMSQDALMQQLHRALETQQRWEFIRRGFFAQEWMRWNRANLTIGDEEVAQYYEQNKPLFLEPERRKLREIAVSSEPDAKRALARLLDGTVQFEELASQISLGETASSGGLMESWVMRGADVQLVYASPEEARASGVVNLESALEAAAFAIDQVGVVSSYVKGADGRYHLYQLTERQDARQRPLAEVQEGLKRFLLVQKLQQAVEGLRAKATIERFTDRLNTVTQPTAP